MTPLALESVSLLTIIVITVLGIWVGVDLLRRKLAADDKTYDAREAARKEQEERDRRWQEWRNKGRTNDGIYRGSDPAVLDTEGQNRGVLDTFAEDFHPPDFPT